MQWLISTERFITPRAQWLIIAGAAATVCGAVFWYAWWLWWRLPKRQLENLKLTVYDPKARADIEDNFRKTAGQILVGIGAVLIGSAFTYFQFWQQQQRSSQQEQASQETHMGDQFVKPLQLLGADQVITRVGGVYSLEEVLNTSEQYHRPILETLCAFVRDGTRTGKGEGPPATDIQAALTVIGRRVKLKEEPNSVDLSHAHIPRAVLEGDWTSAGLENADLTGAILSDTNLNGAWLPAATLVGAFMVRGQLENTHLEEAKLNGALLDRADLASAFLLSADLTGAILTDANLRGADLTGANLRRADLAGADLWGVKMDSADLRGTKIVQAQLDQACGTKAKLDPGFALKPC